METLSKHARELGISLTRQDIELFRTYQDELLEWNSRFNLTAITREDQVEVRHFLDSLTCVVALRKFFAPATSGRCPKEGLRVLDVGSGAGFPGVPLKILCASWNVTLLEATGKKVTFLEHLRSTLGLEGLDVVQGRAEDLGRDAAHREQYDLVVARAVAEMPVLVELLLPFVRLGGLAMAMKAAGAEAEVASAYRALSLLGGELWKVISLELPGLAEPRRLVLIRKVARTPEAYPRRPGIPSKRPLK